MSLVSVVIAGIDGARYVKRAMESLQDQDVDFTGLVFDADRTLAFFDAVSSFDPDDDRFEKYSFRHRTLGGVLCQYANEIAQTSPYIGFLSAFDELGADTLAGCLAALEGDAEASCAYSGAEHVGPAGEMIREDHYNGRRWHYPDMYRFRIPKGFFLYRRGPFEQAGGFDSKVNLAINYSLMLRVARHGRLVPASGVLSKHRHCAERSRLVDEYEREVSLIRDRVGRI